MTKTLPSPASPPSPYPISPKRPTKADFEKAQQDLDEAQARLAQAKFDLNIWEIRRAKRDIRDIVNRVKVVYK